jgi:hypothetical protein
MQNFDVISKINVARLIMLHKLVPNVLKCWSSRTDDCGSTERTSKGDEINREL